jgi:hypothetical protein
VNSGLDWLDTLKSIGGAILRGLRDGVEADHLALRDRQGRLAVIP